MKWSWLLLIPSIGLAQEASLEGFSRTSVLVAVGATKGRVETLLTDAPATALDQVLSRCESWRDDAGEHDIGPCTLVSHCMRPGFFAVARGKASDGSFRFGVTCGSATDAEARVAAVKSCSAAGASGCEALPSSLHEI